MTNLNETLYTASASICSELYVGTREEWKYGNMEAYAQWHSEKVQKEETELELNEWIEQTLDECLTEADEDEIEEYERLESVTDFQESLNFTTNENEAPERAIKIEVKRDINIYGTLCMYCADNDIDLTKVANQDFEGAANTIENYGSVDHKDFYFWID